MAVNVTIDGKNYEFEDNYTIIQACDQVGIEIPRFCYHKRLAIAGNCRMCLVDTGGPKPIVSCANNIVDKMNIVTQGEKVNKARADVMELLLINHPLDCPVCDQGGECDLQDQALLYGRNVSIYKEEKRVVPEKDFGKFIKTAMTRCIHCMRCVRFMNDIAGIRELDILNRGEDAEIISAIEGGLRSDLSGNIIDLCPVGALIDNTYKFKVRPWELKRTASIDINDSICPDIYFDSMRNEILRILPRENDAINEEWISNKTRFGYDGLKNKRLMDPLLKISNDPDLKSPKSKFKPISWDEAIKILCEKLLKANPSKIAVSSGGLTDYDTLVQYKEFCEEFRINNFDCRSLVPNMPDGFDYLFESTIQGIDEADCILILGCDIEVISPVLNSRIRRNVQERELRIGVIGRKFELRFNYEFIGETTDCLKDSNFYTVLLLAKKPMIIFGDNIFSVEQDFINNFLIFVKNILLRLKDMDQNWKPINVLHQSVGVINGLKAGFYNKEATNFNQNIGTKKGFEVLYLLSDDEINISKSDAGFIVYQGHHGGGNAIFADLILPTLAFTEKSSLYFSVDGSERYTEQAVNFPGNAMKDLDILKRIKEKLKLRGNNNSDETQEDLVFNNYFTNFKTSESKTLNLGVLQNNYYNNIILANSSNLELQ